MLKKLLKFSLILLVLVVIGAGLLVFFIDPIVKKLRPQLLATLSSALHHQVEADAIDISLFPTPVLQVRNLKLANGEKSGLSVEALAMETSLAGILSGHITISSVDILNGSVSISRDNSGKIFVGGIPLSGDETPSEVLPAKPAPGKPEPGKSETSTSASEKSASGKSVTFEVSKISGRGLTVEFHDAMSTPESTINLSDASFTAIDLEPSKKSSFEISGTLLDMSPQNVHIIGEARINSLASISPEFELSVEINPVDVKQLAELGSHYGVKVPGLQVRENGSVSLEITPGPGGSILAKSKIDLTSTRMLYPVEENKNAAILVDKSSEVPLALHVDAQINRDKTAKIEKADLLFGISHINAAASVADGVVREFTLSSDSFSTPEIERFLRIPAHLAGDLSFAFTGQGQPAPETKLPSGISGTVELHSLGVFSRPDGASRPLEVKNVGGKLSVSSTTIKAEALHGIAFGEEFTLDGSVAMTPQNEIKFDGISLKALSGTVQAKGVLNPEPDSTFRLATLVSGVELKKLFDTALPGGKFSLTGKISSFQSSFQGNKNKPGDTTSGSGNIAVGQGAILGVNLLGMIFDKVGKIPGLQLGLLGMVPENAREILLSQDRTNFDSLKAAFEVTDGKAISISNLDLSHSLYSLTGNGTVVVGGSMDLKMQLRLTPLLTAGMVAREKHLKLLLDKSDNLTIPVIISKSGSSVTVLPDASQLLQNAARNTATEAATNALDKLAPGLGKGAKGVLNSLFK